MVRLGSLVVISAVCCLFAVHAKEPKDDSYQPFTCNLKEAQDWSRQRRDLYETIGKLSNQVGWTRWYAGSQFGVRAFFGGMVFVPPVVNAIMYGNDADLPGQVSMSLKGAGAMVMAESAVKGFFDWSLHLQETVRLVAAEDMRMRRKALAAGCDRLHEWDTKDVQLMTDLFMLLAMMKTEQRTILNSWMDARNSTAYEDRLGMFIQRLNEIRTELAREAKEVMKNVPVVTLGYDWSKVELKEEKKKEKKPINNVEYM